MSKASRVLLMMFLCLLFVGKAHAQEVKQAPTIEQCRGDQRLWLDKVKGSPESMPNYEILTRWAHEMFECKSVDPENGPRYYILQGEIDSARVVRLEHFLDRQGLYDKFIEEDKAGKR